MERYLIFIIKSAFYDFLRNKLRTFLTSLGILIGVFSVVILVALGLGLKKYISDQFASLGKNTVFIIPGNAIQGGNFRGNFGSFVSVRFDLKDIEKIKKIKNIEGVAPIFTKSSKVEGSKKSEIVDFLFSSEVIQKTINLEIDKGRFFDRADIAKKAKVTVVGFEGAKSLFGDPYLALGKTIDVDNVNFKIIGVLKSKGGGGLGGPNYDKYFFSPYSAGYVFNPDKKFIRISVRVDSEKNINQVKSDLEKLLLKRYKEEDFSVIEPKELLSAINSIFNVFNFVLIGTAAISLIVGGVGIMNIMYVTVIDKTKEIGIRRAVGATKKDILYQFLLESVFLSVIGGILGLLLAYIAVFFIQSIIPAYINLFSVVIALGVSSVIGIIFGVFPAKKAADLEPVEAIRYE